jgi:23S rRNA pseudouridine1911/1915/1917 synthase
MWEFQASHADRLDRSLRDQRFPGAEWLSRQAWDWLFSNGRVTVNGRKAVKAGANLSPGDAVRVDAPEPLGLLPHGEPARVVWEGDGFGVFDKPVGIDTVAQLPWDQSAFASRVAAHAGPGFAALAEPPSMEGGLVQRLDRDTSGLVCAAFSREAKRELRELFTAGKVAKTYDALVTAPPEAGEARVWLGPKEEAEEIALTLEIYKKSPRGAWLRVRTRVGQRHVVRAGLAALGAPLFGDALYGGDAGVEHHQLHAFRLELPQRFEASPPDSFLASAAKLGLV